MLDRVIQSEATTRDIEQSRKNYEDAAHTITIIAEQICSIEVPESTIQNWKKLLSVTRTIDDRVDHFNSQEDRLDFVEKINKSLKRDENFFPEDKELTIQLQILREILNELEEGERHFFERIVAMIFRTTEDIKNEN